MGSDVRKILLSDLKIDRLTGIERTGPDTDRLGQVERTDFVTYPGKNSPYLNIPVFGLNGSNYTRTPSVQLLPKPTKSEI